jgi:membrane-bound lytic murein transglycosylase B
MPRAGALHRGRQIFVSACLAALLSVASVPAAAETDPAFAPLVKRLVRDGLPQDYVETVFASPRVRFNPQIMADKMVPLIRSKVAPAPPRPTGSSPYAQYLSDGLIDHGRQFMAEHAALFAAIEHGYALPPEVPTAILIVETKLGQSLGRAETMETLASMAACEDFRNVQDYLPMNQIEAGLRPWVIRRTRQKAEWAYGELGALLRFARGTGLDPATLRGSPFGAFGLPQFMPSIAERFAVDGDGDGRVDLFDLADAIKSMAEFLKFHGWKPGLPPERALRVIMAYNPSQEYAQAVLDVAERLRAPGS